MLDIVEALIWIAGGCAFVAVQRAVPNLANGTIAQLASGGSPEWLDGATPTDRDRLRLIAVIVRQSDIWAAWYLRDRVFVWVRAMCAVTIGSCRLVSWAGGGQAFGSALTLVFLAAIAAATLAAHRMTRRDMARLRSLDADMGAAPVDMNER